MNANHTPGPWMISSNPHRIASVKGRFVATLDNREHETPDVLGANARLIAAAPELLAELSLTRALLQHIADGGCYRDSITQRLDRSVAAIAKATTE